MRKQMLQAFWDRGSTRLPGINKIPNDQSLAEDAENESFHACAFFMEKIAQNTLSINIETFKRPQVQEITQENSPVN